VYRRSGELDEALASGTRALAIAQTLRDLELRILATSFLEQVHYFRGEYKRVIELATEGTDAEGLAIDFKRYDVAPEVFRTLRLELPGTAAGVYARGSVRFSLRLAKGRDAVNPRRTKGPGEIFRVTTPV
jgi:hypothetical protein